MNTCAEEGDVARMKECLKKGANFDNRIVVRLA